MRHDHDENFNLLDDDVQVASLPTNQAKLDAWLRSREREAAASESSQYQSEAIAAPQPAPSSAPVETVAQINDLLADLVLDTHGEPAGTETIEQLDDDELTEALAELEERDERTAAAYVPPSKSDGPKVTTPEGLARLRKQTAMIRDYIAKDNIKKAARTAERYQATIEANARIQASERQARADARRARGVVGRRTKRAAEITKKRIAALDDAIATKGGKFYVKLAKLGAQEYAQFRDALTEARRVYGDGASMDQIAAIWSTMTGTTKTKPQVQNRLDIVAKLEAKGGPWYPWRKS
jgi:hypothetical protein